VEGINDLITFEGESVQELKNVFYYVIDEHIRDCEAEKILVEKSYNRKHTDHREPKNLQESSEN
jgi:predicted HicB family RNase H-like nuclease